ncbi:MAG: hypothetical protein SFV20_09395 [Sphingopyxis sp.]|nr:hypothetical protein [Sphingopyxis sp.]
MIARLRHHFPALASVAIRAAGVALGFLIVIIIGRTWGPEGSGVYGLVSQTAMFLGIVAVGGLDLAAVRALSGINPATERLAGQSIVRLLVIMAGLAAIPVTLIVLFGNRAIALLIDEPLPVQALSALMALLVARTMARMMSAILRAQRYFLLGQAMDAALIPALFGAALLLLVGPSLDSLLYWMMVMAIAAILVGLAAIIWVYLAARHSGRMPMAPALQSMAATALPLWGVTIALNFADWYGLTVVTSQLGLAEAGIYRVVMQFATVFSLLSTGLFGVYSVRIAAAQAQDEWAAVARLVRSATLLSAALVTIPAIILIIAAKPVLGIVGPEFQSGATALQIGLVGQILYIITGPAGLTLAMTGHARINLAITMISTASLIVFAPLAASHYGTIGVVGCISALLVARNLASLAFVRRQLGINALSGRYHPPA